MNPFGDNHPGVLSAPAATQLGIESLAPSQAGIGAPNSAGAVATGNASAFRSALANLGPPENLSPAGTTLWLPPVGHDVDFRNVSLFDLFMSSKGSAVGQSAVADWVGCPEYSRLRAMGVEMKPSNAQLEGSADLDAAPFGTMMHALRATRLLHGNEAMYQLLERWRSDLTDDDYLLAKMMWRVYDTMYPLANDLALFEVLGVEVEVRTALKAWDGRDVVRTVRYDTIIRYLSSGEIASFEFKTMARSGRNSLRTYYKQGASQQLLWNANPELVGRYGPMGEVLYDCGVKTKNPTADRIPERFSRIHQELAKKFLLSPDQSIVYMQGPDGRFPQNLSHCYQFYRPCQFVDLCWEHAFGMYRYSKTGETYDGR